MPPKRNTHLKTTVRAHYVGSDGKEITFSQMEAYIQFKAGKIVGMTTPHGSSGELMTGHEYAKKQWGEEKYEEFMRGAKD